MNTISSVAGPLFPMNYPDATDGRLRHRGSSNLVHWNAEISHYTRSGLHQKSVSTFLLLLASHDQPDEFTFPSVIKSCAAMEDALAGQQLHGMAAKRGLLVDSFVLNALVSLYGKCGRVKDARKVFAEVPEKQRSVVTWNRLLSALYENGMVEEGTGMFLQLVGEVSPDEATLVTVLPMCALLDQLSMGQLLHGLGVKLGLAAGLRMSSALISMYAKCGGLDDAERVFLESKETNAVSWNAMIGAHARHGDAALAFDLCRRMLMEASVEIDEVTVLNVLPACSSTSDLLALKELHGFVIRNALWNNKLLPNALVAAYAKCGLFEYATHIFNGTEAKTVCLWNALMGGCSQNGDAGKALELFVEMKSSGLEPDFFTIGSLLLACSRLKNLHYGKEIHGFIMRKKMEKDSFIRNSLLSVYIQCGKEHLARLVFDAIEMKDIVSWNAMIAGYSQKGMPGESLNLFRDMQQNGCPHSEIAITGALTACAQTSAVRPGKELHCCALKAGYAGDNTVGSSIIDMYTKCGYMKEASYVFNKMENKDVVAWSIMLTGYAANGRAGDAISLYKKMQEESIKPDDCTYIGLLMACSHAGMVERGLSYFNEMYRIHRLEPSLEHYACVIDMLGRAGRLAEAASVLNEMPMEADSKVLSSLLGACRVHGCIELGEQIAERLLTMEPGRAEHYVLASNLYARCGRWDDAKTIRKVLDDASLHKDPGCSWIDVEGNLHSFVACEGAMLESIMGLKMLRLLQKMSSRRDEFSDGFGMDMAVETS